MEYQALYRKYRPQRFADIVGQDHVTTTLAREIVAGKVAHAYLYAGPRGTGKTTTARILAKALNCPNRGPDGEPDNTCVSCIEITEGSSIDVIELDAASHNKVEDIRDIRVNVGTVASVAGRRRIYILDEAHMLSRAASNALLKTLEEPPEHVHFVLATTEPYKLPDTVRSRSQRFDFHPVPSEILTQYLAEIAAAESFDVSADGLVAIAHHAEGSVRDALSLLEQVAALGAGTVDATGVARALGLVESEAFGRFADAVVGQDARAGLELVAEIAGQGADLRRFVGDALAYFRGVFLTHYAPNVEEVVDEPHARIEEWRSLAGRFPAADVLRTLDHLSEALVQLRDGREERLVVELTTIRLTRPETALDPTSLAARLDRLEDRLRRAGSPSAPAATAEPTAAAPVLTPKAVAAPQPGPPRETAPPPAVPKETAPPPAVPAEPAPAPAPAHAPDPVAELPPVEGLTLSQVETAWPALVARVRENAGPRRYAYLREALPGLVEGSTLVLNVPSHLKFHLESLTADEVLRGIVEDAAAEVLGGRVTIEYRQFEGTATPVELADGEEAGDASDQEARAPDKSQLVEAGDGAIDPTDLVVDMLGGEVVDE